ncbi:hypothetical protein ACO9S2_02485 [Nitrospira sp. NS4]|uniref:hypothetical protein n=1 Tax=Nitrospira sp. NS4 TaxID=3414498 RepID=UPI003C304320
MKLLLALCFVLSLAAPSFAQTYQPFQIARPVGVGTAGTGLHASNRIYRAYAGIPYQIHADAVGGRWPYTYSLSGAPTGMTIEPGPCTNIGPRGCTAGTITWSNPTTGTTNPITVTIRDADGRSVTGTWSINVSTRIGADGFCFLDANNGNDSSGTGSLAAPFRSIARAYAACGARSIIYFRAGTYTIDPSIEDGSNPGDCGRRVLWYEPSRGVTWLAYPGQTPVIDFESTGNIQPCFQMQGENIWIDGLEIRNVGSIGFKLNLRSGGYGAVVRNVNAHDLRAGLDGSNSSFFLWTRCDNCPTWFDTVQNSYFANVLSDGCSLKVYGVQRGIFETSAYSRTTYNEATIALKGTVPNYTVRANTFASDVITGVGGNMDTASVPTGGEIYHNLSRASGTNDVTGTITIGVAKISSIALTQVYRNTFIGQVTVSRTTSTDGPYYFYNNVIVNSTGGTGGSCARRLSCYYVTDYSRINLQTNNLQGAPGDGIVDANGLLQGSYRTTWIGQRGFELAGTATSGGTDTTPPAAPQNVQLF